MIIDFVPNRCILWFTSLKERPMKRIGIVINPYAKKNKKMKVNPVDLYRRIGGDMVEIRATRSLDEIYTVAEEFRKKGISYLGTCGGDGTLHQVLSRFLYVYKDQEIPPLLILKGGTMDTISRSIGLKGKGPDILKRLIGAIGRGDEIRTISRETIRVEDRYCFLFGLGLASNFLREYYKGGNTGPAKAVLVLLKAVFGGIVGAKKVGSLFERFNARLLADEREIPFNDFIAILAGTVVSIGIGFNALFRAYEKPGTFHMISSGMKPTQLALRVNSLRRGVPIKHPCYDERIAHTVRILGPKKFQYMMDGDLYEASNELLVESGRRVTFVSI